MPYYSFTHIVLYCILILVIAPLPDFPFRGAPDYCANAESEFHAEAHEQLRVKDLPRVPTQRLLRWIRTRNPPAARHRTYPQTTAPQVYIVVLYCIVLYSTFIYCDRATRSKDPRN